MPELLLHVGLIALAGVFVYVAAAMRRCQAAAATGGSSPSCRNITSGFQ